MSDDINVKPLAEEVGATPTGFDLPVSALPTLEDLTGHELLMVVVNNTNYKASISQLAQGLSDSEVSLEDLEAKADKVVVDALTLVVEGNSEAIAASATKVELDAAVEDKVTEAEVTALVTTAVTPLATKTELTDGLSLKASVTAVEAVEEAVATKAEASIVVELQEQVDAIVVPDTTDLVTQTELSLQLATKTNQTDFVVLQDRVSALEGVDHSTFATQQQLVEGLSVKATLSQLSAVEAAAVKTTVFDTYVAENAQELALKADASAVAALQEQVDGLAPPDVSALATKAELNAGLDLKAGASDVDVLHSNVVQLQLDVPAISARVTALEEDSTDFATKTELTEGLGLKADQTVFDQNMQQVGANFENQAQIINTKASTAELNLLRAQVEDIEIPDTSALVTQDDLSTRLNFKVDNSDFNEYKTETTASIEGLQSEVAAIVVPDVSTLATKTELQDGLDTKASLTALAALESSVVPNAGFEDFVQSNAAQLGLKADKSDLDAFKTEVADNSIPSFVYGVTPALAGEDLELTLTATVADSRGYWLTNVEWEISYKPLGSEEWLVLQTVPFSGNLITTEVITTASGTTGSVEIVMKDKFRPTFSRLVYETTVSLEPGPA